MLAKTILRWSFMTAYITFYFIYTKDFVTFIQKNRQIIILGSQL